MNKIILEDNIIKTNQVDTNIKFEMLLNDKLNINTLNIEILDNTNLELEYNIKTNIKLETNITINENLTTKIYEKINGNEAKIRTKYNIKKNSNLKISKFNDISKIKEYIIIYLEQNSRINYNLKTIATDIENYDILTYHNEDNSISEINTNGVNIKNGILKFNISSFVPKNIKNCNVKENNKIINLTNNECIIKPNLYIDEHNVEASHSAWIGGFKEKELFYLKSRGIKEKEAIKLLTIGFLTNNLDITKEEIENIKQKINNYWR